MHMPTFFHSRQVIRRIMAPPNLSGLAGALAGSGGGLAMALIGALLAHALDQDGWLQLKVIAGCLLGSAATAQTGFVAGPILVGLLLHLAVAALLGALFELGLRRIARWRPEYASAELAGLAYGLLIWLVAFFIVMPVASPLLLQSYAPALLVQHLVYGAVTGLLYSILRPQPSISYEKH